MSDLIYEGKAKKVFKGLEPHQYVLYFKDDATAFNAQKKDVIESKGILNQKIASQVFQYLENHEVQTHFIKSLSDREMLVEAVHIIPVEVIVRNITAGSLCKRLGIEENIKLDKPLIEFCLKSDALGDPIMMEEHIYIMNLATHEEIQHIRHEALKINTLLQKLFDDLGITLADFKLEFGKTQAGKIVLADEITPDGCRLWDQATGKILDKDRFRKDLGGLAEAYQEVLTRMTEKALA
ncbi:MAG: phosphoribosylaminoimidazolesuccinocarboxamide synthase [Deltaproteobacteria bacterium]|nr:phosphoribosylaminoimidazolesuccinocarboxamide synthase [Deltaproteobacteria bacterium]